MDEQQAIARLKQNHIDGLETLVNLHQVKALRAVVLICHDYARAEDIVQNAFVRAYERIQQFDSSKPFAPWFLRSVVNDALMAVRKPELVSLEAQTENFADHERLFSPEAGLYEQLEAAETKAAIREALARLSPHQRAAIVLRYYLDMNDQEISQLLNCPPGTVRRRMHDARQRLRQILPAWVRP